MTTDLIHAQRLRIHQAASPVDLPSRILIRGAAGDDPVRDVICVELKRRSPTSHILLMKIFPRGA
jgi:hypothetical protein